MMLLMALAAMSTGGGPVTRSYTSGDFTELVPAGVSSVIITIDGPGGAGAIDPNQKYSVPGEGFDIVPGDPGGGGGGGRCTRTIAVVPGNTLACSVGAAVAGRSTASAGATGAATTVVGTVSGGAVNMTADAGQGGAAGAPGVGGAASGGTVNTAGSTGFLPDGGGAANGAAGGTSGTPAGTAPGGGGQGKVSGTSGPGARGQITFEYS